MAPDPFGPAPPPGRDVSHRHGVRTREHLTPGEVEALIEAAKANRYRHRDGTMTMLAFRHGLRVGGRVAAGTQRRRRRDDSEVRYLPARIPREVVRPIDRRDPTLVRAAGLPLAADAGQAGAFVIGTCDAGDGNRLNLFGRRPRSETDRDSCVPELRVGWESWSHVARRRHEEKL